jgi:hypothetical protein
VCQSPHARRPPTRAPPAPRRFPIAQAQASSRGDDRLSASLDYPVAMLDRASPLLIRTFPAVTRSDQLVCRSQRLPLHKTGVTYLLAYDSGGTVRDPAVPTRAGLVYDISTARIRLSMIVLNERATAECRHLRFAPRSSALQRQQS